MIVPLATSRNSTVVYLDDNATHVMFHIRETPDLLDLVKEAIEAVDVPKNDDQFVFERDMGRVVGTTTRVHTGPTDEIVYAKRKERDSYSRFVKNRQAIPCRYIVIVLRNRAGKIYLWTAMCGRLIPAVAVNPSSHFWTNHALVYDDTLLQMDTMRTDNPFSL